MFTICFVHSKLYDTFAHYSYQQKYLYVATREKKSYQIYICIAITELSSFTVVWGTSWYLLVPKQIITSN